MGRSDDSISRRKNRKRLSKDSAKISTRVASIIAAKKRRKSGKRRLCQGMCFSLPTPEDPFNDGSYKQDSLDKKKKPSRLKKDKMRMNKKLISAIKNSSNNNPCDLDDQVNFVKLDKLDTASIKAVVNNEMSKNLVKSPKKLIPSDGQIGAKNGSEGPDVVVGSPSKFLICCLNSIQNGLLDEKLSNGEKDRPLFAHNWGVEFWKLYSSGKDILEASRADLALEKIAWVASCAADTIARKEKEGVSFSSPFLLFLFPSQEKTAKARQICKPLKAIGVHSVSLHAGASIDHQIQGLQCCEPEFLLSTPARLLELLSLKAVDISGVALLVIDGRGTHPGDGFLDGVKILRESISSNPQTVVFCDCKSDLYSPGVNVLVQEPVQILSADAER